MISFDPAILALKSLTQLHLYQNQFTELDPVLWDLTALIHLSLQNNTLTELSSKIGNLKNLTCLYLGYNKLTDLPKEFENLKDLKWLGLDNNQLTRLPEVFGELKNLEFFFLRNNQLTCLSESFYTLWKQRRAHLHIDGNPWLKPEKLYEIGKKQLLQTLRDSRAPGKLELFNLVTVNTHLAIDDICLYNNKIFPWSFFNQTRDKTGERRALDPWSNKRVVFFHQGIPYYFHRILKTQQEVDELRKFIEQELVEEKLYLIPEELSRKLNL